MLNIQQNSDISNSSKIENVIEVNMNVTKLKQREAELQSQKKKNYRLHSAKIAAKEINRLKNQFFANMSHKIRTFIANVIEMFELLIDIDFDKKQKKYVENI